MSKQRQLRKQEEIRGHILDTARAIIAESGVQGLSIRKITNAIDYSPAIIYHYFKDKNEIVSTLVQEGYGKILAAVSRTADAHETDPEQQIRNRFSAYIEAALSFPEEYRAFMLHDDPVVLARTSLLSKGISEGSPAIRPLRDSIQTGMDQGKFAPGDAELTAQLMWTATFGLIMKLITEKQICEEQSGRLVEQHLNMLMKGIK